MPLPVGTVPLTGPVIDTTAADLPPTEELYNANIVSFRFGQYRRVVRRGEPGSYTYEWGGMDETFGYNAEGELGISEGYKTQLAELGASQFHTFGWALDRQYRSEDFFGPEGSTSQIVGMEAFNGVPVAIDSTGLIGTFDAGTVEPPDRASFTDNPPVAFAKNATHGWIATATTFHHYSIDADTGAWTTRIPAVAATGNIDIMVPPGVTDEMLRLTIRDDGNTLRIGFYGLNDGILGGSTDVFDFTVAQLQTAFPDSDLTDLGQCQAIAASGDSDGDTLLVYCRTDDHAFTLAWIIGGGQGSRTLTAHPEGAHRIGYVDQLSGATLLESHEFLATQYVVRRYDRLPTTFALRNRGAYNGSLDDYALADVVHLGTEADNDIDYFVVVNAALANDNAPVAGGNRATTGWASLLGGQPITATRPDIGDASNREIYRFTDETISVVSDRPTNETRLHLVEDRGDARAQRSGWIYNPDGRIRFHPRGGAATPDLDVSWLDGIVFRPNRNDDNLVVEIVTDGTKPAGALTVLLGPEQGPTASYATTPRATDTDAYETAPMEFADLTFPNILLSLEIDGTAVGLHGGPHFTDLIDEDRLEQELVTIENRLIALEHDGLLLDNWVDNGPTQVGVLANALGIPSSGQPLNQFSLNSAPTETVEVGDFLIINDEWMRVTDITATTVFTVERAANGTTAASHTSAQPVFVDGFTGRTLTEQWNDQSFHDLGIVVPEDWNRELLVDVRYFGGPTLDFVSLRIPAAMFALMPHTQVIPSIEMNGTFPYYVTRSGQRQITTWAEMAMLIQRRRLTAADVAANRGAVVGDDAMLFAFAGFSNSNESLYKFQARISLTTSR